MTATVHMRVLELSADIASIYVCNYVEPNGKCRPRRSNFVIVRRSRQIHVPSDVLALYAYQASSLCIDQFDAEFYNISQHSGTPACFFFTELFHWVTGSVGWVGLLVKELLNLGQLSDKLTRRQPMSSS